MRPAQSARPDAPEIHRLGSQLSSLPPRLEELVSLWLQKCAGRPMPEKHDMPAGELRPWAGNSALIDLCSDRIRVCGPDLIRRFGREATGAAVADLAYDISGQLRAILNAVVKSSGPVVAVSRVRLGHGLSCYSEAALPLSGEGRPVAVLLASYSIRER